MRRFFGQAFVAIANAHNLSDSIVLFQDVDQSFDHIIQAWAESAAGDDRCTG